MSRYESSRSTASHIGTDETSRFRHSCKVIVLVLATSTDKALASLVMRLRRRPWVSPFTRYPGIPRYRRSYERSSQHSEANLPTMTSKRACRTWRRSCVRRESAAKLALLEIAQRSSTDCDCTQAWRTSNGLRLCLTAFLLGSLSSFPPVR